MPGGGGRVLLAATLCALPAAAGAQPADDDEDPGVARRMKDAVPAPVPPPPDPLPLSPAAAEPGGIVFKQAPPAVDYAPFDPPPPPAVVPTPAPAPPARAVRWVEPEWQAGGGVSPSVTPASVAANAAVGAALEDHEPPVPRAKLGYRRFTFVRPGATSGSAVASESFDNLSLDIYPVSSIVRLGLSTQLGWESGRLNDGGDYLFAESLSLGVQRRGRVTPFGEFLLGGGYMRRMQVGMSVPTAYWQFGLDGGCEIYLGGRSYVSVAIGYLRPVNGFVQSKANDTAFTSIYLDTWSFKVGVGI